MKILVYGAGVIGSIFAYKLKSGGNDVSILARGKRLNDLKEHGLIIQDDIFHKEYKTEIKVVDRLNAEDRYDIILVIMQRQQISAILPILKENISPLIIFIGNNPTGATEYLKTIDKNRFLLGFGGPGGYREDYKIIAAYVDDAILYIGELDGMISDRIKMIEKIFINSGIKVDISPNIDAWLKTHMALISPLAMGGYAAKKRNKTLGTDKELVNLAIQGIREFVSALKDLNIPILPKKFKLFTMLPNFIIRKKLVKLLNSDFGRIALSGHAKAAENEMKKLSDDIFSVVKNAKTEMSSNEKLYELSFA
ncbi:MAG: ketopantoate reductase family protein [Promethearchaeota archaeon]